jgi:prophage maintenance system killer protein
MPLNSETTIAHSRSPHLPSSAKCSPNSWVRSSGEKLTRGGALSLTGGRSGTKKIVVGAWRDGSGGPMQVLSGPAGRERVHYEAPEAGKLDPEMKAFLEWFNTEKVDPLIKAALAHLWFVTIHPFDDGNGRIARAIADMSLARSENSPQRFYSMSAQIRVERNAYYDMLEGTQKGELDVTPWLEWFLGCLDRAFDGAETILAAVLEKAEFWKKYAAVEINDRQRDILNRLLDGFEGKLTSSKWALNLLNGFLADAVVEWPPARKTAGEDFERVGNRCLHANGFAHGRDDGDVIHSSTPFGFVGFFRFHLESLQRIAPKTVQPFAQFHQTFPPQRINPAHAFAAFFDKASVFQNSQVLRHGRSRDRQACGQHIHRTRPRTQALKHLPPCRVSKYRQRISVSHG